MRCGCGGADVSPIPLSLVAFKPRQVILLEQKQKQRNTAEPTSMGKITQLKREEESILTYSIAMWIENKGFSKVLNRFVSAAKIQDDDWKAQALNLNEIFSKYQEICNDVHEDLKTQKNQDIALNRGINCAVPEEIECKKKKKKNRGEAVITDNGKSVDTIVIEKVKKSNANGKEEERNNTTGVLSNGEKKSKLSEESNDSKVHAVPVDQHAKTEKEKKKKKSKLSSDSRVDNEKQIHVMDDAVEEKHKGLLTNSSDSKTNSEVIVEVKEKRKKKKLKVNLLNVDKDSDLESKNKVVLDKDAGGLKLADNYVKMEKKMNENDIDLLLELSGAELNGKSKKKSIDAAKDEAGESNKDSKKRKRMAADINENQLGQEFAVEESKPKKAKGLEEGKNVQAQVNGANGHAPDESSKYHLNSGVDNLSHSKSGRKQPTSSSKQPKTVNSFQRVKVDEVEFVDERLQDNSYWAKDGAESGYGAKAQEVLGQVKGRDFRHEKTKKKRGSYRGGQIDLQSHSIKFDNSDDE